MSIEISGMDELVRNLSNYSKKAIEGVVRAAQISQALVVNDARSDHPYIDRTGNLTNSIQAGAVEVSDNKVEAEVQARMEYASFVEYGTSRARAYPFLVPALLRQMENFRRSIMSEVSKIR